MLKSTAKFSLALMFVAGLLAMAGYAPFAQAYGSADARYWCPGDTDSDEWDSTYSECISGCDETWQQQHNECLDQTMLSQGHNERANDAGWGLLCIPIDVINWDEAECRNEVKEVQRNCHDDCWDWYFGD